MTIKVGVHKKHPVCFPANSFSLSFHVSHNNKWGTEARPTGPARAYLCALVVDVDFDLDGWVDGDGRHVLDNLSGAVQVNDALVHSELKSVPGLGTLTARRLTGGDLEHLGGQADGAANLALQALVLGGALQLGANCKSCWRGGWDWLGCGMNASQARKRSSTEQQLTLLEGLHVTGGQGDADSVLSLLLAGGLLGDICHLVDW
jgi:hypothetical protein